MENDVQEEILDFEKPSFTFKPNEVHEWRQQGPYLVCKSCELVHSSYIGIKKIMTGIKEDGTPILESRRFISR